MKGFSCLNPRVLTAYFLSVLLISMFIWNPVIQIISLLGGLLFLSTLTNVKEFISDIGFYIILFMLITVTNPLFSHNGETPLFFLNGKPITLESIVYGGEMAVMIISVIIWCKCLNRIMTTDKILYILGGAVPKLSLLLSMSLRFIPLFKKQTKKVSNAQKTMGLFSNISISDKAINASAVLSSMTDWSLENALETSNSMKSRGYGLKARTNYFLFKFTMKDMAVVSLTTILMITTLVFTGMGTLDFNFYPTISKINLTYKALTAYIAYGILAFFPFLFETEENIKWKYYISKI